MANWESNALPTLPKPGRVLTTVMLGLFGIWLMFAMAINWGGASASLFALFCGNQAAILEGQVWRLFTAALIHEPRGDLGHIMWALLGLYFLSPSLEQRFGGARFARFLAGSAVLSYSVQCLLLLILPASIGERLVANEYWFGSFPVIEAVAIAWALNFQGQQVRLFFFIPASSKVLIWMVIGLSVLRVIALSQTPEGLLSPFGGMFAGWLLGGGTPSPLRRAYLKWKLARLEQETKSQRDERSERVRKANLRVVAGGKSDKSSRTPKDWLN